MDTVEWVEIASLLIVIALVIPIYRFLGVYTKILNEVRRHHERQAERITANANALDALNTRMDEVDAVLGHLSDQVDRNGSELRSLREGIGAVAAGFAAVSALVNEPYPALTEPSKD